MKDWAEEQAQSAGYSNVSDYVRDLICRDQERAEEIAAMQRLADEGLASGIGERSASALFDKAKKRAEGARR
jgi:antitoxin ParD1/3/4